MKIACIFFSESGRQIAEQGLKGFPHDLELIPKKEYKSRLSSIFDEFEGVIFICSVGIAVRLIAPLVKDKHSDPGVVVVDDTGKYAISVLSGHIGGANQLTREIASHINATPIITTASDNRNFESLDVFAQRHNLAVEDWTIMKQVMTRMVNGEAILFEADDKYQLDYKNIVTQNHKGSIVISNRCDVPEGDGVCILRPRVLNIGIGCRRGTEKEAILLAMVLIDLSDRC